MLEHRALMAGDVANDILPLTSSHNHFYPQDVNEDRVVTPGDVLSVVNAINMGEANPAGKVDVNGDQRLSPSDALIVIDYLNGVAYAEDQTVLFRYSVTDLAGNPKSTLGVGERFLVQTFVQDTRDLPSGVFSAYLTMNFPDSLVSFDMREKQTVSFTGSPAGGNFTLTFDGQTTAAIPFKFKAATAAGDNFANAESIQAALEALSGIGVGNVKVSPTPRVDRSYEVFFGGKFANTNVANMTATNTGLTGGNNPNVAVAETTGVDPGSQAHVIGSVQYNVPIYVNGLNAELGTGQLKKVGGFDGLTPLGGDEYLLFQVEMTAKAPGAGQITGETANESPQRDVTLYGVKNPVCPAASTCIGTINFGSFDFTIANDPIITGDTATVAEDTTTATVISVLGNDTTAKLPLTITAVTQGTKGTVANNSTSVSYTPTPNEFGVDTFTYTAQNADGISGTGTVTVTITAVNDPPVANPDPDPTKPADVEFFTTMQNTSKEIVIADAQALLAANDNAGPGEGSQTLDVSIPGLAAGGPVNGDKGGNLQLKSGDNTKLIYTPAQNYKGPEIFTYTLTDNGTPPLSATGTFTVMVQGVNQPPSATNDTKSINEDNSGTPVTVPVPLTIPGADLTGNDSPGAGDEGQTLTVTGVSAASTLGGTVSVTSNTVTYTPPANTSGTDTFTYTITDNGSPTLTATGTVTVTITEVNDPPQAVNDDLSVDEGTSNNNLLVLLNDNAGPNEPTDTITITQVTNPTQGGTVSIATDAKSLVFTPDATKDAPFTDTFSYTIRDSAGLTTTANVSVDVVPLVRPKARKDVATTAEGSGAININVLSNDLGNTGFPLRITRIVSGPSNGQASISTQGTAATDDDSISYTPNTEFSGTDVIVYEIDDDFVDNGTPSAPSSATIEITVTSVNDPPVNTIPGGTLLTDEGTPLAVPGLSIADIDAGAGQVSVTLSTSSTSNGFSVANVAGVDITSGGPGSIVLTGTLANVNLALGGVFYSPSENFNGNDTITMVSDDKGNTGSPGPLTDTDTIPVTVKAINDAPVNTVAAGSVIKNQSLVYSTANGNAIQVADVDSGAANIRVDLTVVTGKLSVGSDASVTVEGSGTASVRLTGPIASINTLLGNGVTYQPLADSDADDTLTVTTSDLGNTGDGGAKTDTDAVAITVLDFVPSIIGGSVFVDADGDGSHGPDESGLANVTVRLTGTNFQQVAVNLETKTDLDGKFEFANLSPGSYQLTEVQPANVIDGGDLLGTSATLVGNDTFSFTIAAAGGLSSSNNEFGESGLTSPYAGLGIWDLLASSQDHYAAGLTYGTDGVTSWFALGDGWSGFTNIRLTIAADQSAVTITALNTATNLDQTVQVPVSSARVRLRQFHDDQVVRIFGTAAELGFNTGAVAEGESAAADSVASSQSSGDYAQSADEVFRSLFARG